MTSQTNRIAIGDVVQIDPAHDPGRFGGCFLVVTEVKTWGVQGYAACPGETGVAYYRVAFTHVVRIGTAEWTLDRGEDHEPA